MEEKIDLLLVKVAELQMNIEWMIPRMAKAGSISDLKDTNSDLLKEKLFSPIPEPNYSKPTQ